MGYTHYWSIIRRQKKNDSQNEIKYQFAIQQCTRLIQEYNKDLKSQNEKHPHRLSGFSVHTKNGEYLGLSLNGTQELAHETFNLAPHLIMEQGGFCKTARKPYDAVVVACLLIMTHYLPDVFRFESDGTSLDMLDALILVEDHLNITVSIPDTIRKEFKIVS